MKGVVFIRIPGPEPPVHKIESCSSEWTFMGRLWAWATGRSQTVAHKYIQNELKKRKSHVHFRLAAILNKFQLNYIEINWEGH